MTWYFFGVVFLPVGTTTIICVTEVLHRSHGAGMVKNDIISIIFKGNKGQGNSCRSFGLPIRASFFFNFILFLCC